MAEDKIKDPEEGEVNAYMEDVTSLSEEERKTFHRQRLELVISEYKKLLLFKAEMEGTKNEQALNNLTAGFRKNFKERRYHVIELRRMGEKVTDKFVPESAQ